MQEQVFCSLWEGPTLKQFLKDCTLLGTHIVAKGKYEAEGSAERSCYSLTAYTPPVSHCPALLGQVEELGMKE